MIVEPVDINTAAADILARISAAADMASKDLYIPEWGVTLRLQSMNLDAARETRSYLSGTEESDVGERLTGYENILLMSCVYTQSGEPLFPTEESLQVLSDKSADVIRRIVEEASEISGLREDSVEEAEKN